MIPLQITAYLATPLQVFDDWTPSLDAILEWIILDDRKLASSNPTIEDVESVRSIVETEMPLLKTTIGGEWYWAVSSPQYELQHQQQDRLRGRWDMQEYHLDWQGKRQSWSTSEGPTKSWDLPQFLSSADRIDWFAVGDPEKLKHWLTRWNCGNLGKKRRSIVWQWDIQPIKQDKHLFWDGRLMRPIPIEQILSYFPCDYGIRTWGWRPPAWLPDNKCKCAMPVHNIRKPDRDALVGRGRSNSE